jgi:hypothetical protein
MTTPASLSTPCRSSMACWLPADQGASTRLSSTWSWHTAALAAPARIPTSAAPSGCSAGGPRTFCCATGAPDAPCAGGSSSCCPGVRDQTATALAPSDQTPAPPLPPPPPPQPATPTRHRSHASSPGGRLPLHLPQALLLDDPASSLLLLGT